MAKSIESSDSDQKFIEATNIKIEKLKDQVNRNKSELNKKFHDVIISVLERKEEIELEMDEKLYLAITQSTERKMKMANLSAKMEISCENEFQSEIQIEKLNAIEIPEISLEWNIDDFQRQLGNVCKVGSTNHPYAYLGLDQKLIECKFDIQSQPTSFEMDPINGDVYFLCNDDSDDRPDFKIFAINSIGNQKWDTINLERKFCPISLCIGESKLFVSCSGSSHRSKILASNKSDKVNTEPLDHILVIEKQSGKIVKPVPFPVQQEEIGPIAFEPKSKRIFLLTRTKPFPYLSIFDLDGNMEDKGIELEKNRKGYFTAAPKIKNIEISQDTIILFGVDSTYIDIFNLEGKLLHTFPESTGIITVDPWSNILKLDKKTLEIIILTKGEPLTKCILKNKHTPIDLKYDISTGRILVFCLSTLSRLCLVYL